MSDKQTKKTVEPIAPAPEPEFHAALERWFIDTFHNRGIDGPEYNRLTAAKESLKGLLAPHMK